MNVKVEGGVSISQHSHSFCDRIYRCENLGLVVVDGNKWEQALMLEIEDGVGSPPMIKEAVRLKNEIRTTLCIFRAFGTTAMWDGYCDAHRLFNFVGNHYYGT